ncbi:hypothetical protein, partial [Novipirellula sp.]|uniref:hypothetical protein n=1 Tax=Novipirellula sp. TaxID=2795430 RepID=UPI003564EA31
VIAQNLASHDATQVVLNSLTFAIHAACFEWDGRCSSSSQTKRMRTGTGSADEGTREANLPAP